MRKQYIGKLLQIDRGELNEDVLTNGYLLGFSDQWTLIQFVHGDICIDGYLVIRNDTIKRYRLLNDDRAMVHRALRKLGQFPVVPGKLNVSDINTIVQSATSLFPLVVIHRELRWKDECHIGGLAVMTPKTITIASIGTGAVYNGPYRIRSADITQIGFDGHYEKGLWAAASVKTKKIIAKSSTHTK